MIIMQLNNITKYYGAEKILANIKIEIKHKDRIAIVGRNGSGKSTLLKIMANQLSYDSGEIIQRKDLQVGYLPQETTLESTQSIWQEMVSVFTHLLEQEEKLRELELKMQKASALSSAHYDKLMQTYDQLQQSFQQHGGYQYEANIKNVLNGLDFPESMYETNISTLSGGQKTRLALGKLLLQNPDLLILDEPTNHLDIETLTWLENYLENYPGAIVIVSHDRYFLDKTVSTVYEISRHETKRYNGTYSQFLEQKQKLFTQQQKAYEEQQSEIKKMEDFIQRNIARASTTKRAQSRRKQLEKMTRIEQPLGEESSAKFSFEIKRKSGHDVLQLKDIAFGYDRNQLVFRNVNLHVTRGERVALIGANGIGKTTLLKVINQDLEAEQGDIVLGTNVQIGYYDQEQSSLTETNTVLEELWQAYPHVNEREIRTILGNFLFSGDDVLKQVQTLSGGEKARLALAKLMMEQANLLILDEPTNHLDIDSKEVLESALINFPGTIIFVSHDRYFINKIADRVVEIDQQTTTVYLGDYDYYIHKKQEMNELEALKNMDQQREKNDPKRQNDRKKRNVEREQRRIQRQIDAIETEIEHLEEKLTRIELEMTRPEVYEDHEKALAYSNEANEVREALEQKMKKWETLQIEVNQL